MNAWMRASLGLLFASTLVAGETQVRVSASRGLRLAVIDASKATPARDAIHLAFAASLSEAVSERCGGQVGVQAKCVGVDNAVFNLGSGVFDAVVVLGPAVPAALRKVDGITLSASPEAGKRDRMIFLIVGNGDTSLQGLLAGAFAGAMNNERFLDLFIGGETKVASANGAKVASAD